MTVEYVNTGAHTPTDSFILATQLRWHTKPL
jgi:hypothetical protein